MGFPRQKYWSGFPFPPPGDLPDPGIEPMSPALAGGFFTTEPPGTLYRWNLKKKKKSDTYELILQNRNMYFTKQKYVYSQINKTNLCLPKWVSGEGGEIK